MKEKNNELCARYNNFFYKTYLIKWRKTNL